MTDTHPASTAASADTGSREPAPVPGRTVPPAAHYLFALAITLATTGLAFPVQDFGTKWIVFSTGVVMTLGVLLVWARDGARQRRAGDEPASGGQATQPPRRRRRR